MKDCLHVRLVVVPPPPPVAAPVEASGSGSSSSTTVRVVGIGPCMVESWSWLGLGELGSGRVRVSENWGSGCSGGSCGHCSGMALGLWVSSGISVSEIGLVMVRNEREEGGSEVTGRTKARV